MLKYLIPTAVPPNTRIFKSDGGSDLNVCHSFFFARFSLDSIICTFVFFVLRGHFPRLSVRKPTFLAAYQNKPTGPKECRIGMFGSSRSFALNYVRLQINQSVSYTYLVNQKNQIS